MAAPHGQEAEFPCSLTVHIPFPSNRLACAALRSLAVDEELSPLVRRTFSLVGSVPESNRAVQQDPPTASLSTDVARVHALSIQEDASTAKSGQDDEKNIVLKTDYEATTNRMLRVAVNGFFESLGTIIQVMEELDLNVVHEKGLESLEGAQGVEQGLTGSTG